MAEGRYIFPRRSHSDSSSIGHWPELVFRHYSSPIPSLPYKLPPVDIGRLHLSDTRRRIGPPPQELLLLLPPLPPLQPLPMPIPAKVLCWGKRPTLGGACASRREGWLEGGWGSGTIGDVTMVTLGIKGDAVKGGIKVCFGSRGVV